MAPPPGAIRSVFLEGPAGQLEGLLNLGSENATHAALVCHPHPVFGGTMHNKVVFHAMKALNRFGFPVLRFNFRGTGLSQGEHDHGRGEVDEFHLPLISAGFSFGAAMALGAACADDQVKILIALGLPVAPVDERSYDFDFLRWCGKPRLFISGSRDQFGPRARLEALVNALPGPKQLVIIDSADHFFEGRLREMREAIEEWVERCLAK
jgi:uncharacterized protein